MVDVVLKAENGKSSSPRIRFNILLLPALVSPDMKDKWEYIRNTTVKTLQIKAHLFNQMVINHK